MYISDTNEFKNIMRDRERILLVNVPVSQHKQVLMNDPVWAYANKRSGEITADETKAHFKAAETGPELMHGMSVGPRGPGYTGVGMNPELFAQRRLEEDEEKMYGRTGLFGMTPYGWA